MRDDNVDYVAKNGHKKWVGNLTNEIFEVFPFERYAPPSLVPQPSCSWKLQSQMGTLSMPRQAILFICFVQIWRK